MQGRVSAGLRAYPQTGSGVRVVARIRNLKPEFWDSPDTAEADLAVRLTYMAMWNWADDSGKGTANLKELEAFAWPNDDVHELPRRGSATQWPNFGYILAEVQRCYGVVFYKVRNRPFYFIPSFKGNQSKHFKAESNHPMPEEGQIWDLTSEFVDSARNSATERPNFGDSTPNIAAPSPLDGDKDGDKDGDDPAAVGNVTTQRENDEPKSGPSESATIGAQLVAQANLPDGIPKQTLAKLRVNATNLVCAGSAPAHVLAALRTYGTRTGVTPGLLADLVADEAKRVNGTEFTNHRPATSDLRAAQAQALKNNPPSRLELE